MEHKCNCKEKNCECKKKKLSPNGQTTAVSAETEVEEDFKQL